jgi:hypothetical protein
LNTSLGRAVLELATEDSSFFGSLDKAEKRVGGLRESFSNVGGSLKTFGRATSDFGKSLSTYVTGPIAGVIGGLAALATHAADTGDAIAKNAREAGLSGTAYQELAYAIGQSAQVGEEEITKAFGRITKTIGDAAAGNKPAIDALRELGFSQEQIAKGSITTEEAFNRFNTAMQNAKTPADAAAVAGDLLGDKLGQKLAGALRDSGGEIDGLRKRAHDLGLVMSDDALTASENFNDAISDLKGQFGALGREIGTAVMPVVMNTLIPFVRDTAIPVFASMISGIGEAVKWFGSLPEPVQRAGIIVAGLAAAIGPLLIAFGSVVTALGAVMPAVGAVAGVLTALASGPVLIIGGAIALLAGAWWKWGDDIKAATKDAVGWISEKITTFSGWISSTFTTLKDTAIGIWGALATGIRNAIFGPLDAIRDKVATFSGSVSGFFGDMYDKVVGHSFVPDMITGISTEFARLPNEMVQPAQTACSTVGSGFSNLTTAALEDTGTLVSQLGETYGPVLSGIFDDFKGGPLQGLSDAWDRMKEHGIRSTTDMVEAAGEVLGAFAGKNKAIAIASAIIDTYVSVAKTLATTPWPANLFLAAGALAAGMANVAKIRSTNVPGYATGTPGLDFMDFGSERQVALHNEEAVIPRGGGHQLAGEIAAALKTDWSRPASAGGTESAARAVSVIVQLDRRKLAEILVPAIPGALHRLGLA